MGHPKFIPKTAPCLQQSPPSSNILIPSPTHSWTQMASGSNQPFCHNTLSGHTHTHRWSRRQVHNMSPPLAMLIESEAIIIGQYYWIPQHFTLHPRHFKHYIKLHLYHKQLTHCNKTKLFWPSYCFWHFFWGGGWREQKIGKAIEQILIHHPKIILKPFHGLLHSKMHCSLYSTFLKIGSWLWPVTTDFWDISRYVNNHVMVYKNL